jgi:hypothetical protein
MQCTVAPSGSGVTCTAAATEAAAAAALALVPGSAAEVTTILGPPRPASVACRFALEGEGVKFVSGVEGVWIAGMGAVDSWFGGVPLV